MLPCGEDPTKSVRSHGERFPCPWCGCEVIAGAPHPPCGDECLRWNRCPDCGHLIGWHVQGCCWEIDDCVCQDAPAGGPLPWEVDASWTGSWIQPGASVTEDRQEAAARHAPQEERPEEGEQP